MFKKTYFFVGRKMEGNLEILILHNLQKEDNQNAVIGVKTKILVLCKLL